MHQFFLCYKQIILAEQCNNVKAVYTLLYGLHNQILFGICLIHFQMHLTAVKFQFVERRSRLFCILNDRRLIVASLLTFISNIGFPFYFPIKPYLFKNIVSICLGILQYTSV